MLILSRRIGRSIEIGEKITVTVLEIRDGQVRLGINAPRDIPVHREEVAERIRQERERSPIVHCRPHVEEVGILAARPLRAEMCS